MHHRFDALALFKWRHVSPVVVETVCGDRPAVVVSGLNDIDLVAAARAVLMFINGAVLGDG